MLLDQCSPWGKSTDWISLVFDSSQHHASHLPSIRFMHSSRRALRTITCTKAWKDPCCWAPMGLSEHGEPPKKTLVCQHFFPKCSMAIFRTHPAICVLGSSPTFGRTHVRSASSLDHCAPWILSSLPRRSRLVYSFPLRTSSTAGQGRQIEIDVRIHQPDG